jgi:hypothetical protein
MHACTVCPVGNSSPLVVALPAGDENADSPGASRLTIAQPDEEMIATAMRIVAQRGMQFIITVHR